MDLFVEDDKCGHWGSIVVVIEHDIGAFSRGQSASGWIVAH